MFNKFRSYFHFDAPLGFMGFIYSGIFKSGGKSAANALILGIQAHPQGFSLKLSDKPEPVICADAARQPRL